ncbi:hypothetical protein [Pontixanthobacter sp. CEM42]|uniref:hypothetical protein n=1 Tax=Pontixanthobacter sp. CEM42 TaxID=2792077 RepID=UPI001AE0E5DF|nr:hypothetical protein [Pontixanthobacter sp. CEM42]
MAKTRAAQSTRKSRRWPWVLLLIAIVLAAAAWFYRTPITGYAGAGAAYSARVACSCRFVARRSLDDCKKDQLPGMEFVTLKEDVDAKSVTARFPLIISETATYREGYGCVMEEWRD